jgi:hypothetical protein
VVIIALRMAERVRGRTVFSGEFHVRPGATLSRGLQPATVVR